MSVPANDEALDAPFAGNFNRAVLQRIKKARAEAKARTLGKMTKSARMALFDI